MIFKTLWLGTVLLDNYGRPKHFVKNEVFGCLPEDVVEKLCLLTRL